MPTAAGLKFCFVLKKTEHCLCLRQTTREERRSGSCLDFPQPGYRGESIPDSPHRRAGRWAADSALGCRGGVHGITSPCSPPSPSLVHPLGTSGAPTERHQNGTWVRWGNRAGASIEGPIDGQDAMVGDVKYTWKVANVLGPLCWRAQTFFPQ